jgi:hypothetical protein
MQDSRWQMLTGEPDGPPTKSAPRSSTFRGYASAIAVLAGIWRARRDGAGATHVSPSRRRFTS